MLSTSLKHLELNKIGAIIIPFLLTLNVMCRSGQFYFDHFMYQKVLLGGTKAICECGLNFMTNLSWKKIRR